MAYIAPIVSTELTALGTNPGLQTTFKTRLAIRKAAMLDNPGNTNLELVVAASVKIPQYLTDARAQATT